MICPDEAFCLQDLACGRLVRSKSVLRGRTMQRMILVSLLLLALVPVGSNAANAPDQKQKAMRSSDGSRYQPFN